MRAPGCVTWKGFLSLALRQGEGGGQEARSTQAAGGEWPPGGGHRRGA